MEILDKKITKVKEPIAATIGFFDGVHLGHRFLLDQLKSIAQSRSLPSAVITFIDHPRRVLDEEFQPALLSSYEERLQRLGETGVDYCIPIEFTKEMSKLSAKDFMQTVLKDKFNVKTLLIGYDHRFGHDRKDGFVEYLEYGRQMDMIVIQGNELDTGEYVSSSRIRELLHEGEVEQASKLLTYNYSLTSKVVEGNKVGHTIGFPTANIDMNNSFKIIPSDGVYACYIYIDGKKYRGMLYIGKRSTLYSTGDRSVEVNIFDFDENIYGKEITIEFLRYFRRDAKFSNLEILIRQLKMDEERIRKYITTLEKK